MAVINSRVKWEDPPPSKGRAATSLHGHMADQLKTNPKAWGVVGTYSSSSSAASVAWQIRGGAMKAYAPAGTFNAVSRKVGDEYRTYAVYLGEPAE